MTGITDQSMQVLSLHSLSQKPQPQPVTVTEAFTLCPLLVTISNIDNEIAILTKIAYPNFRFLSKHFCLYRH